jgi:hypothetical protein
MSLEHATEAAASHRPDYQLFKKSGVSAILKKATKCLNKFPKTPVST